ncbi:MAG: class I SAM-dependent methyltransferase [Candidatus Omnitrophota bacterium]|nr:MAG: class I SAM-dependent methyltransferase [Candidatus Omnitrophota bacterium]
MLRFLGSFSEKEWRMNGHSKKDLPYIINIFLSLLPHIEGGNYFELGCGTGILCKFIYLFSPSKIIPYGIDLSQENISLAAKNNPKFRANFFHGDYFRFDFTQIREISTVVIFISSDKPWDRVKSLIIKLLSKNKCNKIILFCYEENFLGSETVISNIFDMLLKKYNYALCRDNKFVVFERLPFVP